MMSDLVRRVLALAVAVGGALVLAWLSQAPYAAETGRDGVVRLSWRARGERVEQCRPLSEEERAQLPPHMRLPEVCEGKIAPYVLSLELDGALALLDTIRATGARGDRPLYVFHDVPVAPGSQEVRVRFVRQLEVSDESPGPATAPIELELETSINVAPGAIALITLDPASGALILRQRTDR